MTFFLNAWLEREDPLLELREAATNRMVYYIEGDNLNEWLHQGDFTANDLNCFEGTHDIIRDLLLRSISEVNQTENKNYSCMSNVIKFPRKFKRPNIKNVIAQKK